jgi:hypothetical protein
MWKLKDGDDVSKEDNAKKIKELIEDLRETIVEIKHIEIGFDVSCTDNSYDMVLYSEFETKSDCAAYMKHPDHQKAGGFIGSVVSERKVVDYEY